MFRKIGSLLTFISDLIILAFMAAFFSGVVQVVKGPYWGNFEALLRKLGLL